jgi:hypothetical protein
MQHLWQKATDKEKVKVIREQRGKEREETKKRCAIDSQNVVDITTQRLVEKWHRIDFN